MKRSRPYWDTAWPVEGKLVHGWLCRRKFTFRLRGQRWMAFLMALGMDYEDVIKKGPHLNNLYALRTVERAFEKSIVCCEVPL